MPKTHGLDEATSLVNSNNKRRRCLKNKIIHYAIATLLILMLISFWAAEPMASAAVRREIARWNRAHEHMVHDIEQLREEKRNLSDDIEALPIERDEKRREWELQREEDEKRRRGHVPFWGKPRRLSEWCPKDRFRRYEARMYNLLVEDDWYAACKRKPILIDGHMRRAESARKCINHGLENGVLGYWSIAVTTRECPRNFWDWLRNLFR